MFLSTYRREILGAIFGGLVSLAVGLLLGLHSVTKTLELQINKNTLATLKRDLHTLKSVSRELNQNIAISGNVLLPSLEFRPKLFPSITEMLQHTEKDLDKRDKELKDTYQIMKLFAEYQEGHI
ncbi:MAG: hypothetical protein ACREYE_07260 [Gammaproteobacteria bacterium]